MTRPATNTIAGAIPAVYSATPLLTHTGVGDRHYRGALVKLARQLPEPARGVLLRRVGLSGPVQEPPVDDDSVDPEGSASIIDLVRTTSGLMLTVRTADLRAYDVGGPRHALLPDAVRVFGPGAGVAKDLEPEYVVVSSDGRTAWVALQENNALAIVDLDMAQVVAIRALGFKDHRVAGTGFDASDRDGAIAIRPWPFYGMYMPDGIALLEWQGATYVLTADEGDARDYDTFSEEARVKDLELDPIA